MHKVRGNYSIVVYVGAANIYVAAVEALRENERGGEKQDETQFTTKIGAFLSFSPP
jgi:hypothetical protein